MKEVRYSNQHDTSAYHKTLAVDEKIAGEIEAACGTHRGELSTETIYVDVCDWDKAIEIINLGMSYGHTVYREQRNSIKIPA